MWWRRIQSENLFLIQEIEVKMKLRGNEGFQMILGGCEPNFYINLLLLL